MKTEDGADLCYPHLYNDSCNKPAFPRTEIVLLQIILYFISVVTVVLNLLVIISVSHFRQLHTPTNILLLSLAVSDLLMGFLIMPGEIYQNTSCWFLGDNICLIYNYLTFVIPCASVGHMVLISVDRYVAICEPLHYPSKVTERRVKVCVILCWLCSIFYSLSFIKDALIQTHRANSCYGECLNNVEFIEGTLGLVFIFIAPVTIIIVLYMRVFVVAVSQARAMRSHIRTITLQLSATNAQKSELKAARTLGILVVLFLVCFCPSYCVYLAGVEKFSSSSVLAVDYLFYFNSCVNPVVYALFYPWFRKTVKLIITLQIMKPGSRDARILHEIKKPQKTNYPFLK